MNVLIGLIITIFCLIFIYLVRSMQRPKNYPPGPPFWPWVGNTYQLRHATKIFGGQHIAFEEWSKEYNSPILGLKLANDYVVVALTYPFVREIHTREEFNGRPDNFFLRLRTMGTRLGITCTDGLLWTEQRNFTTRHLREVGYARMPMEIQIQNELNELLAIIKNFHGKPVWSGDLLPASVINVLWALAAGKRIPRNDDRLQKLLDFMRKRSKAFDMCGGVLTQFPWLRFIAPEKTGYNLIRKLNLELHEFFMETINDHKANYTEERSNDDLIYAYIKEMKEREGLKDNTFTDLQLTMTILDLFIAGSQTTSITLDLAFMQMVIRPDIQDKVIKEIDSILEDGILPSIHYKLKLPYTDAVLMEVQRYYHIVPLTGPRRVLKTTTLGDYIIPKNSTILIGIRSVMMDENHWQDPKQFKPERFLDKDGKVFIDEYYMPFGQGKRRCLGDALARACLFTFFVGILQKFRLKLPDGASIPDRNLQPGIVLSPKKYNIEFISR